MELNRALLYACTLRHLRPAQVVHRVRLRGQRVVVGRFPGRVERILARPAPAQVGWPEGFTPIDARLSWPLLHEIEAGKLTLLGHTRNVGMPLQWRQQDAEQLWRYHLQYWDWAWGLARESDRLRARAVFRRMLTSWQDQARFGQWDEWSPYVVALRAWSWCGQYDAFVRGSDLDEQFVATLGLHARYLQAHLELDVGGNHLIKDLKALVGLGVFLGDERMLRRALRGLRTEVARQVLPDGGHFERAPAYHCQVLADLIDIDGLLGDVSPRWLSDAVKQMRRWLGLVLLPDGTVPLLNDGYPVAPELLAALKPGPPAAAGLTLLPDSGLGVLRRGDLHVLADVGLPCPDELPAHAHADTLSFLLYAGTTRLVTECGTSTYQPGAVRDHERGTAAHSTVQVDGADSTEVWGAFRAARRARPTILRSVDDAVTSVLSACHDGYTRLSGQPVHTRTWTLTESKLRVVDEVTGDGTHHLVTRFHGTPRGAVRTSSGVLVDRVTKLATAWNQRADSAYLEHAVRARLPWRFQVELTAEESA